MDPSFLSTTLLLFLVLDPFGNTPFVAALLRRASPRRRLVVVLRECLIAYAVLLVFLLFGPHLLGLMHLSQTSLGIAGGVVLFIIALHMIFPSSSGPHGEPADDEPFIVPLAVPAIAGPSAMAMVMLLATRDPERIPEWIGAISLAMLLSTAILLVSARLVEFFGARVMTAMERLMGMILITLAVEMLLQGIESFVGAVLRQAVR